MKYDSEYLFWNITWATVTVAFLGFFAIIAGYYSDKNKLTVEAVKNAANPIAVSCAINLDSLTDKSICAAHLKIN